jgi:hypothetical protein
VILPLKPGAGLTLEQQWGADGGAFEEAVRDRLAAAAAAAVDVRSFVRVAVPGSDEVRARDPRSADPDPGPSKSPTGRKLVKPLPVGRADAAKRRPTGGLSQQQGGAKEPPGVPDVPVGPRLAVRSDAPPLEACPGPRIALVSTSSVWFHPGTRPSRRRSPVYAPT